MMKRYAMMALPLALAPMLAACGGGADMANNGSGADDSAVVEAAPDNLQDDPGNAVVPIGNGAMPAAQPVAAIPAQFQGRWGMVPNDCDPNMADAAKGLMTVTGDRLSFYESRATPSDLKLAGSTLTATLAFSGEGQTWQQQTRLVLQDDGKTLVRSTTGGEAGDTPGPQRYSRCPAAEGAA